jgi:hypothetical protein
MKKNQESKKVTKKENWQILFELPQLEKNRPFTLNIYHNPEMTQIKQVGANIEKISHVQWN